MIADVTVIAAVNDRAILRDCLAQSPDIASGALPLVTVEGATSMAEAYNRGLDQSRPGIILFAHQDVYLPQGFLARCLKIFEALEQTDPDWMVAGPYGVTQQGEHVGRVWDVTMGRELGAPGFAATPIGSLDELLLILKWDGQFRFDPELPHFHLYGTDLVQSALALGRGAYAVELPVVHNNRPIPSLGGGYADAYRYTRRKWRAKLPIPTTICDLSNNPLPLARVRWRRWKHRARREQLLADAVEIAQRAGYE